MRRSSLASGGLFGLAILAAGIAPRPAMALDCVGLQSISSADFSISSATPVIAGFSAPGNVGMVSGPFCRVIGVATPVPGSQINFEVWLPPAGIWNGRFRGEGSGGSAGSINYAAMADGLNRNYASMANDNGHTGSSWTFSEHPEAVVDFGYRAQHVTTMDAKTILQAFYGQPPEHSYFVGCSQGGHHALMEAERYPTDYDGIIGGDPASDWTGQMLGEVWIGLASTVGGTDLPQPQLDLLTSAVLQRCVGQDGGLPTDQFLTDPRDCVFNPTVLQCGPGQDPATCLSAAQVRAVRKIYHGPRDTITGQKISPGLAIGSETFWRQVLVGTPLPGGSALSFFRDAVFDDPNYDFANFNFGRDVALAHDKMFAGQTLAHILNANNTNFEPFRRAGGKLIMYHGWADPFVPSQFSIDIYTGVVEHAAASSLLRATGQTAIQQAESFARLFMVPGMNHCAGGPGANNFGGAYQPPGSPLDPEHDMVEALDAWVSRGVAPDRIVAVKYNNDQPTGDVAFSRPLCPYPQTARFVGQGDPTSAANFACAAEEPDNNGPPFLGLNSYPNGLSTISIP